MALYLDRKKQNLIYDSQGFLISELLPGILSKRNTFLPVQP